MTRSAGEVHELNLRAIARRSFIESYSFTFGPTSFWPVWEQLLLKTAEHGYSQDSIFHDLEDDDFFDLAVGLRAALLRQRHESATVHGPREQ